MPETADGYNEIIDYQKYLVLLAQKGNEAARVSLHTLCDTMLNSVVREYLFHTTISKEFCPTEQYAEILQVVNSLLDSYIDKWSASESMSPVLYFFVNIRNKLGRGIAIG